MDKLWVVNHSWLIPLMPLIGAAIAGLFGAKWLKGQSHWPIWLGVGASAVMAFTLLFQTIGLLNNPPAKSGLRNITAELIQARGETDEALKNPPGLSTTRVFYNWIEVGDPNMDVVNVPDFTDAPDFSLNSAHKKQQENPRNAGAIGAGGIGANGGGEGGEQSQTAFDKTPRQSMSTAHFLAEAAFFFDPLTAVMLCVICGIGFLITVFSAGYMKGEAGYFRFFAYLGLFIFMMTCLVLGNNLIMLYLGWEGVGLCSYLLIGYYYEKPAAREAAKKAFLVNRIGDFGFGIGIMLCYLAFGTVTYFGNGGGHPAGLLQLAAGPLTAPQAELLKYIPFCLMLGAFGKSAQFPLYVWLPDAMEGPTPVSALIHAATMVTAGVYMIARCGTLFVGNSAAMTTIAVIGAFTAFLAATIALRQFDLKKIFAYSTISQLGFMFVAVGALAPIAGVFHLVTHAFFKALLFLSSGVVMHAMAGELDMRKMSGIKKVLPITNILMLTGCLALAGFPPFSGFFSKDDIVNAAFHMSGLLGVVMLFVAFLTAYYTFRLYFRVFQGPFVMPAAPASAHGHGHEPQAHGSASHSAIATATTPSSGVDTGQTHHAPAHGQDTDGHGDHDHNHEPMLMILPLILLAIGALAAGLLNFPGKASFSEGLANFLEQSPSISMAREAVENSCVYAAARTAPLEANYWLMAISAAISALGIFFAYVMHLKSRRMGDEMVIKLWPLAAILQGKYWVDEMYQAFIVEPLRELAKLLANVFDRFIVDGLVNLAGMIPQAGGIFLKMTVQRGYLQGYAAAMLFGAAIILLVIFLH